MKLYTDNKEFADLYINGLDFNKKRIDLGEEDTANDKNIALLVQKLFNKKVNIAEAEAFYGWEHLFLSEFSEESQFDALIELSREHNLPDKLLCQAGSGKKFHGFRRREWHSLPGNLHISAFFAPKRHIEGFGTGFLTLAAVSVVQAIDFFADIKGKAGIKWVNDVVIGNAKVAGVLAQTQLIGNEVSSALIGIGLNAEATPFVEPTPFVPVSKCLNDFSNNHISQKEVFDRLSEQLMINYEALLAGKHKDLLSIYREKSAIIGKNITIWSDERDGANIITHKGKVSHIGDMLELYLEGNSKPILQGRLSIDDDN